MKIFGIDVHPFNLKKEKNVNTTTSSFKILFSIIFWKIYQVILKLASMCPNISAIIMDYETKKQIYENLASLMKTQILSIL